VSRDRYEYQKDIKVYIGFVTVIAAYQYYRRSRNMAAKSRTDRLIVQTGTGNSVLRFDRIDYLEALKNYVSVHADGREYVIRETMTNVMRRLSGGPFARTHRSFIVNLDKVSQIRSVDSKQRAFLHGGQDVPLSRSYRDLFTRLIAGDRPEP
jgi:DNA-binding LytR/AlgR family response regulator